LRMHASVFVLSCLLLFVPLRADIILSNSCTEWDYEDFEDWDEVECWTGSELGKGTKIENQCKTGITQSPVALNSPKVDTTGKLTRLEFAGYPPIPSLEVTNIGHTFVAKIPGNGYYRDRGLFPEVFFGTSTFHIHARPEELVKGLNDVMSLHIVHLQSPPPIDGSTQIVSVISILFNIGETENMLLAPLVAALPNMTKIGQSAKVHWPGFQDAFLTMERNNRDSYYQFEGSLTTPPCSEPIFWTVLDHAQSLTQAQLDAFRNVLPNNGHNNRPPQRVLENVPYFDPIVSQTQVEIRPCNCVPVVTPLFVLVVLVVLTNIYWKYMQAKKVSSAPGYAAI